MTTARAYPRHHFSLLTEADLQKIWHWRNQPHIRTNMHNEQQVSWPEHQAWFSQLTQNNKVFFVLRQNERPIGALYFSPCQAAKPATALEWGCYLGEDDVWPGSGLLLEIAALDYATAQPHCTALYAEVLSFNTNVLKMHRLFGYQPLPDKTGGIRNNQLYQIRVFRYRLADWRNNRSQLLAKLPKQIAVAADLIQFDL